MNPERRAWYILLGSFTTFLVICGLLIFGLNFLIFRSMRDLVASLTVASGTVMIAEENGAEPLAVTDNKSGLLPTTSIITDANSQALLTYNDPQESTMFASIRLLRESDLTFDSARTPRFAAGKNPSQINLSLNSGQCEISNSESTADASVIRLMTPHGMLVISDPGEFLVEVNEEKVIIQSLASTADFIPNNSASTIEIADGEIATISIDGIEQESITVSDLLTNGGFDVPLEVGWASYNDEQTNPEGFIETVVEENETFLVFDRSQTNWPDILLGHGETGIIQNINHSVTGNDQLTIRLKFIIEEQSLLICGEQGSECPLMIRLSYRDTSGNEQVFITGLYANPSPNSGYPLTCDTCRSDHTRININTWYEYDSGNLLARLPEDIKPEFIRNLTVYASGHAYRVMISEILVMVDAE